jgi:4-amino-4-deoxy-L-arabinose transferase-like glycosyltransferase
MLNKIKINMSIIILLAIIALGLILRTYHLSDNPAGFFCDEAAIGYNAYSILTTGKDEYGVPYPIFFKSFEEYKSPIQIYSTIPFISIFGLNELSTRLPSVAYGLITIIIMYLLGKEIYPAKRKSFGLLVAFITATMPWLIHYNRIAFELSPYVLFFTSTIYLLIKSTKHQKYIIPAFILAALTIYTYQPAKLLIPLLLLGFLIIHKKTYSSHKKNTIIGFLSFCVLCIPFILSLFNGEALARFNMVSVFSANLSFTKTAILIIQNYITQLSLPYFTTGEPVFITRHFAGGLTPLLITTLPFLLIGIIHTLLTLKKNKNSQLLTYWLLIYPIAGALTTSGPFTSRDIIGAPLFAILTSIGIILTILHEKKFLPSRILTTIITIIILINLVLFTKFYFVQYPLYSADFWGWQYGPREIITYFTQNKNKYDDLIMTPEFNAPDIFFKFYTPDDCNKCKLGTPDNSYIPGKKQLFAITPLYMTNHPNYLYIPIKRIYYPNGKIAFILTEIKNK